MMKNPTVVSAALRGIDFDPDFDSDREREMTSE